jgi:ribosomal protein S18 acetylase RimI-like enzyme
MALEVLAQAASSEAVALSEEAGWNQNAADWRFLISVGTAYGLRNKTGRLTATALFLPYGGAFAWIGMVLVSADFQRRGIATGLMRRCLSEITDRGLVAGLDATSTGREVYRRLGFEDVYGLQRYQSAESGWATPVALPDGVIIRNMTATDLPVVAELDRACFGGERTALLENLLGRRPGDAWMVIGGDTPLGFVLAREGRQNHHVGPLVAADETIALALLERALNRAEGPVCIDVADRHETLTAWLGTRGFTGQRSFTRMLMDRSAPLDDPERVFAIAGPELG